MQKCGLVWLWRLCSRARGIQCYSSYRWYYPMEVMMMMCCVGWCHSNFTVTVMCISRSINLNVTVFTTFHLSERQRGRELKLLVSVIVVMSLEALSPQATLCGITPGDSGFAGLPCHSWLLLHREAVTGSGMTILVFLTACLRHCINFFGIYGAVITVVQWFYQVLHLVGIHALSE